MLVLDGLTKRFGALTAVDQLSLTIEPGEIFGLLGPNGAGKTTTLHMAVGLVEPDAGRVDLSGLGSPSSASVRRRIGVAPQALALYDEMTGAENLRFFGRLYGLRGAALEARVTAMLDLAQLADRANDSAGKYSGGMKRRLNLAIALIHEPALVLLDEPTVGVDPQSRNAILEAIERLRDSGHTIVYTTHYMEEAQRFCDRIAIMDHGRVLAVGTVRELIATHGGGQVRVVIQRGDVEEAHTTTRPKEELARWLDDDTVTSVRVENPNLETVFLDLTGRGLRD